MQIKGDDCTGPRCNMLHCCNIPVHLPFIPEIIEP